MKRIYENGETYGDYTLLYREAYRTVSGKYSQRLICKNNRTGNIVSLHPSGLKNHLENFNKIKENFNKG